MIRTQSAMLLMVVVVVVAGCGGGTKTAKTGTGTRSLCAHYAALTSCSPDGFWSVTYSGPGPGASLQLAHLGSRSVRVYQSNDACCTDITWVKPHTLLFEDDYRLLRLDPVTRKHAMIASWSNFVVSPSGRWITGWATGSAIEAETVGVRSVEGKTCLIVPRTSHQSDEAVGFTHDSKSVIVKRWAFVPNNGTTGSSRLFRYAISSLPSTQC